MKRGVNCSEECWPQANVYIYDLKTFCFSVKSSRFVTFAVVVTGTSNQMKVLFFDSSLKK